MQHCKRLFDDSVYLKPVPCYSVTTLSVDEIQQNICLGEGFTDMDEKKFILHPTESYFVRVFVQFRTQLGKNIADTYSGHHLVYL